MSDDHSHEQARPPSTGKWIFIGFVLVAGFFLFTEHRAHVFGYLPYLLLLACPLMHFFGHGHGGHGGHGDKNGSAGQKEGDKSIEPPGQQHH